ncbi:PREDICTED: protein FAM92A1-like [Priapulus caudatus]|uniref:Protein FAM92A1-like n=1 Tax=Priapulus caudatus TaxID=37621 RepID=A0ABM1EW92_PRICU|nr:PREDICTED: protein FAM92A1-like [Priapulus caudatus]
MSLRGSRSSLSSRHTGSENQSKFIQDRVAGAERHLGELCQEIGAYARKTAHLRDKGDEIAATLFAYAESEHYNQTLREASVQFAEGLAAVQDYRQAEIDRLEAKVLQPFAQFGGTVKHIKAETELMRASVDALRSGKALEEQLDQFERKKIALLKESPDTVW